MREPIISVSGLRGVVGRDLTPLVAARYAAAFAATLPPGPIVLARDGRASGPMLAEAVHSSLLAVGRDVLDGGIAATPTVGVLVREHAAAGGVQISASHNPAEYNGLKLFSGQGRVLSADAGQRVRDLYHHGPMGWAAHDRLGQSGNCQEPLRSHLERLLAAVQVDAIRRCHFNVLLDANHGAGGGLGRLLLDALGCNVTVLGGQADGQFAHPPEPTAENLTTVLPAVNAHGADIGFCQDPDADRLAIIDGQGRYLGEEYTQAICFDHVLARRRGPIVTNGASSRMALDIARRHGTVCHRSPVGEAHVVELMIAQRAILGGEGNGGVIDPRVGYVRDSFVGMALVLEAMALGGQTVAELADRLPRYAMIKTTAAVPVDRLAAVLEALRSHFAAAQADDTDGLRLDWLDRWLLVRASNTEPLVRLIAEAPTPEEVEGLREEALGVIRKATA